MTSNNRVKLLSGHTKLTDYLVSSNMQILYVRMEGHDLFDHTPDQGHGLTITRTYRAGIGLDLAQPAPLLVLEDELHVPNGLHQRYYREAGVGS